LREKHYCWQGHVPLSTVGLLSLTLGGRKNKRIVIDDRRLTLCHAKAEGTKALVSLDFAFIPILPPSSLGYQIN